MKTLYFIGDCAPTQADVEAASKLKGKVVFRNGSKCGPTDIKESCDFVAGDVPELYKDCKRQDAEEKADEENSEAQTSSGKAPANKNWRQGK